MTEDEKKAAEAIIQATALEEARKKELEANAPTPEQAKIAALEAEKAAVLEREANYKLAYLKEKRKNEQSTDYPETEDEKIRRITREELAQREITRIDTEKEALYQKAINDVKELKRVIQNKPPTASTGGGGSTEHPIVISSIVTAEQIAAFKARGWTDKDIERYKQNLQKNSR